MSTIKRPYADIKPNHNPTFAWHYEEKITSTALRIKTRNIQKKHVKFSFEMYLKIT